MTANMDDALHVYERWHQAIKARDLPSLMSLYADDATLETPLIVVTLPENGSGVLVGKDNIRNFFGAGLRKLQNELPRWYRTGLFFSNGQQLVWEYPRVTPDGDQTDPVEFMDLAGGLISHHRVYWGWVGFKSLVSSMGKGSS